MHATWLTDKDLNDQGKALRRKYEGYVSYLYNAGLKPYQVARSLHQLQGIMYSTLEDGYALPPHTINLCVNNRCNMKCSYCDLNSAKRKNSANNTKSEYNIIDLKKKHELPLDVCKRIVDEVAWFRPTIRTPWMEPLLYKDLLPLIHYVKSKGLPFSTLTNGLLLPKFASALVEANVDAIRVSLDGPAPIHEKLCGIPGAYDKILQGLTLIADARDRGECATELGCYFTLNDTNHLHLLDFIEDLDSRGLLSKISVSFFLFNYISEEMVQLHNQHHADICGARAEVTSANLVDLKKIDLKAVIEQKKQIERFVASRPKARVFFRPAFTEENLSFYLSEAGEYAPDARCDTAWHTLFVNPDGFIKPLPQCILPPVGNIHDGTFMDVWNGEQMRAHRKLLKDHRSFFACSRCWSIYYNREDTQETWSHKTT